MANSSGSSFSYETKVHEDESPLCDCSRRFKVVMRTSKTPTTYRRRFWGCVKYIGAKDDESCNFFHWQSDNVETKKDMLILRQRSQIMALQKTLKKSRRCLNCGLVLFVFS